MNEPLYCPECFLQIADGNSWSGTCPFCQSAVLSGKGAALTATVIGPDGHGKRTLLRAIGIAHNAVAEPATLWNRHSTPKSLAKAPLSLSLEPGASRYSPASTTQLRTWHGRSAPSATSTTCLAACGVIVIALSGNNEDTPSDLVALQPVMNYLDSMSAVSPGGQCHTAIVVLTKCDWPPSYGLPDDPDADCWQEIGGAKGRLHTTVREFLTGGRGALLNNFVLNTENAFLSVEYCLTGRLNLMNQRKSDVRLAKQMVRGFVKSLERAARHDTVPDALARLYARRSVELK